MGEHALIIISPTKSNGDDSLRQVNSQIFWALTFQLRTTYTQETKVLILTVCVEIPIIIKLLIFFVFNVENKTLIFLPNNPILKLLLHQEFQSESFIFCIR